MSFIDNTLGFMGLREPTPAWPPERLSLALQGGGSFGAFTWGVLDRLLEETNVEFDAISGSSAGAVNAVLLASGLIDGGREEAKARLERFWKRMSDAAAFVPRDVSFRLAAGRWPRLRRAGAFALSVQSLQPQSAARGAERPRSTSNVCATRSPMKLLIGATRVRDGKLRDFHQRGMTRRRRCSPPPACR